MNHEFTGTPGPYKVKIEYDKYKGRPIVRLDLSTDNGSAPGGLEYALMNGYGNLSVYFVPIDQAIANFHLFAASPAILYALIKAVEDENRKAKIEKTDLGAGLIVDYIFPTWYHEAKAAIAQALNLSPETTRP